MLVQRWESELRRKEVPRVRRFCPVRVMAAEGWGAAGGGAGAAAEAHSKSHIQVSEKKMKKGGERND